MPITKREMETLIATTAELCRDDLDLKFNTEPVCPKCGHRMFNACDLSFGGDIEGESEIECGECETPYIVKREVEITYSTRLVSQP